MADGNAVGRESEPKGGVLIVELNQEFNPFKPHIGGKVILHSGIFPDLQFQASNSLRISIRTDKQWLINAGILKSQGERVSFASDFLEEITALSLTVSAPEGEFEASLNTDRFQSF